MKINEDKKTNGQIDKRNVLPTLLLFALSYYNYILLFIIIVGGTITMCSDSQNPIDIGKKSHNLVGTIDLVNSSFNGYRLAIHSTVPVTVDRALEMGGRNMRWIKSEVNQAIIDKGIEPDSIDPYEAVDLVKSIGLPDSMDVWALVAIGREKTRRYLRPNPNDSTAMAFSMVVAQRDTPFGAVFLNRDNIVMYSSVDSIKPYNYKGCFFGQRLFLTKDEEFSHIKKSDIPAGMHTQPYILD